MRTRVLPQFKCPLCGGTGYVFNGYVGAGGESSPPHAECGCGFRFAPNIPQTFSIGEDGWAPIYRQQKLMIEKIESTLDLELPEEGE